MLTFRNESGPNFDWMCDGILNKTSSFVGVRLLYPQCLLNGVKSSTEEGEALDCILWNVKMKILFFIYTSTDFPASLFQVKSISLL